MSYERTDAPIRMIVTGAAIVVLGVVFAVVLAAWVYRSRYDAPRLSAAWSRQAPFAAGPLERNSIERDWAEIDRESKRTLTEYGWVDRSAGVARIPIERAMEWMAEHPAMDADNSAEQRQ